MHEEIARRHRAALIARILAQYDENARGVLPVVSLEEFFEHDWDETSLAPDQMEEGRPPIAECYRLLREIRARPGVQDVLVAIHETPYPDEPLDEDIWPTSVTVYVLATASRAEVIAWAAPLVPDDVDQSWVGGPRKRPAAAPKLARGVRVHALWWD